MPPGAGRKTMEKACKLDMAFFIGKADRIFLFHEGRLAEQGTHSELMRLAGRYAELFTLQASAYVD
jgi:ABC-type transport system involved in Fe-S cluster assembly fused permease/ATPase subunit